MYRQTLKNGAPAWGLTEIAVQKGKELAKRFHVSEELVVSSLYLAHVVFSKEINGKVQRQHEEASARLAEKFLKQWKVNIQKQKVILNAIRAHHDKVPTESTLAEVVKNAECFKFLTVRGAVILLHEAGKRGMTFSEAVAYARSKATQKLRYISLPGVKREANQGYREVIALLDSLRSKTT